jgi:hypothetical protein
MKNRVAILVLGVAALAFPLLAQTASSPLPLPPAVEKELAAKASNVTEVTLDKNMLGFAAKFMTNKEGDDNATRQLIQGLDGIYVRDYEFEKAGDYSMDDIDKLRQYFETSDWTAIVRDHEKKSGEMTDVMVKMVNGESHGMFILSAEPKELSIVLILGPIRMDQLSALGGLGGLGALGDIQNSVKDKSSDKDKAKDKKGGSQ